MRATCRIALSAAALLIIGFGFATSVLAQSGLPLPGIAGGTLTEQGLKDGDVVLVVWASWSPRCKDIVPRVARLQERWGRVARVGTVVFQEDSATVKRFLGEQKMKAPVYLDQAGVFSKRHAVSTLPTLLVFRAGQVAYRGRFSGDPNPVIEKALSSR